TYRTLSRFSPEIMPIAPPFSSRPIPPARLAQSELGNRPVLLHRFIPDLGTAATNLLRLLEMDELIGRVTASISDTNIGGTIQILALNITGCIQVAGRIGGRQLKRKIRLIVRHMAFQRTNIRMTTLSFFESL